tara:strand:+ start:88 stop:273 length:186 start_codon:yes stop_codon:yes gene_type:complete
MSYCFWDILDVNNQDRKNIPMKVSPKTRFIARDCPIMIARRARAVSSIIRAIPVGHLHVFV